jgi:sec-independent protein translocase protein TatA
MFNIGPPELIIILVLALIIFGPKRLPEIGKTVGKSLREFRAASTEIRRELREGLNDQAPAPGTPGTNGEGAAEAAANAENVVTAESTATSQGPAVGEAPPSPQAQEPPAAPPQSAPGA